MNTSLIKVMALSSALVLGNFVLSGCGEDKPAQLQVNNWNCRNESSSNLAKRVAVQEQEGKVEDASLFIKKCQDQKLGVFSEEYEHLRSTEDYEKNLKALLNKWQKEAGIS